MGESTPDEQQAVAIVCIISVRAFLAVYVSASILLILLLWLLPAAPLQLLRKTNKSLNNIRIQSQKVTNNNTETKQGNTHEL